MNCTFFGPVGSFDDLFAEMDRRTDIDFWGITEHGRAVGAPLRASASPSTRTSSPTGSRPGSRWSPPTRWRTYWDEMPMITSYEDSISRHEGRFTAYFLDRGFSPRGGLPSGTTAPTTRSWTSWRC